MIPNDGLTRMLYVAYGLAMPSAVPLGQSVLTERIWREALAQVRPELRYVVSLEIPEGQTIKIPATATMPELWAFSREAFARLGTELSTQFRMCDIRSVAQAKERL